MATSTKQRLRYIDSSGTEQIIGAINGPEDEKGLGRGQLFHRGREFDKLVVRGDVSLKQNLPQDKTEFQGEEEIFFETYDPSSGSWTTRFRGYLINGGLIDRNNEVKALLFDQVKNHGDEKVNIQISGATTNVEVMEQATPSNVVIDHPTETEVQNNSDQDGFVDYDGYSMVDEPRKRVIYEQTQIPGWVLKPTATQDGSGNWIWRYEPIGYGGTVDTIKDKSVPTSVSGSLAIIREWGFTRKKGIINEVELINTENGSKVIGSYSASSEASPNSVDKYGERYQPFQVGFLSSTEANNIAKKIVDRNKEAEEGGNLKAQPRYEGNEANNSFEVRSDEKDIDGVFYATEQINHYPEASTDFTFTFERESEAEAAAAENLRSERRKLYPSSGKGLSGETGSTAPGVGGNTGSTGPDVDGSTADTQPNVAGNSDGGGGAAVITSSDSSGSGQSVSANTEVALSQVDAGTDPTGGQYMVVSCFCDPQGGSISTTIGAASSIRYQIRVEDEFGNTVVPKQILAKTAHHDIDTDDDGNADDRNPDSFQVTIPIPEDGEFREYTPYIEPTDDVFINDEVAIYVEDTHSHGSGTYDADNHPHGDGSLGTDSHPHSDGSLGADNHPHQNGTLQADVSEEDKTDRV